MPIHKVEKSATDLILHTQSRCVKDVLAVLLTGFKGGDLAIAQKCTPPMPRTSVYRTLTNLVCDGIVKEDKRTFPREYSIVPHTHFELSMYTSPQGAKSVYKYAFTLPSGVRT